MFDDVDPAFMFNFKVSCSADPLFMYQWGLQNNNFPNFDINITNAWDLSQGQNVKVAVFDQGIDLSHEDLSTNIYPISYDTNTGNPQTTIYGFHGTHVAGIISAVKDNNIDISGVAPLSKIMSISNPFAIIPNITLKLADGINWAWQNGAEIINNSWGDQGGSYYNDIHSTILENAISNALTSGRNGLGCIVTFASGNTAPAIDYPANSNLPNLLCVGSTTEFGVRSGSSGYGASLDIVAPGSDIMSLYPSNGYGNNSGTSMATPHVSGVAALILSINPCLTNQQVNNIIELTAQKINNYSYNNNPLRQNGTWNNEMGYGLLDAYAAVQMAQQSLSNNTLDLFMKDNITDLGIEPNPTSLAWNSPDIWVRNQQEGIEIDQSPLFDPIHPNYVYVRVHNKSCNASTGNEQLKLYYNQPTNSSNNSNTSEYKSSFIANNNSTLSLIGTMNIPLLLPGQETIVPFTWNVPNPTGIYSCTSNSFNTFLLAKIITPNDPMHLAETINYYDNIKNNNNIAGKSTELINLLNFTTNTNGGYESSITIGNPYNETKNFKLELIKEDTETGKIIFEEAEVVLKMDDILYNAWIRGGGIADNIETTTDDTKKIVAKNNVLFNNINLESNETGTLQLSFNFLTKELTDKIKYCYHIIQKEVETEKIVGGVTLIIKKQPRILFIANAGEDKEINRSESIVISANQINEAAIYNWYDLEGNLVCSGKDLAISNAFAEKYKLEVIANADGCKDYDEVEIKLRPNNINTIYPNPSSENVTVQYNVNKGTSAYLMILGYYGGDTSTSNNYILDIEKKEKTINISNYPTGFYTVV